MWYRVITSMCFLLFMFFLVGCMVSCVLFVIVILLVFGLGMFFVYLFLFTYILFLQALYSCYPIALYLWCSRYRCLHSLFALSRSLLIPVCPFDACEFALCKHGLFAVSVRDFHSFIITYPINCLAAWDTGRLSLLGNYHLAGRYSSSARSRI